MLVDQYSLGQVVQFVEQFVEALSGVVARKGMRVGMDRSVVVEDRLANAHGGYCN